MSPNDNGEQQPVKVGELDPTSLTVVQAVEAIRSGKLTAVEYVEALLAHADHWSALNAFITLAPDHLREQARRVDEQIADGLEVGPLAGVPVVVKDNIHSAGLRTTAGTAALSGFVPQSDAVVLRALLAAGALLGGKTNMHELAHLPSGRNPTFGDVRNPHDLNRTSGGSSAGTAAAVAASIFPAGLGSDTGGSCRIPAALCGCVGFRPTIGRYSQDGLIMLSRTHDTIGLFARSVSDIELLDSICSGEAPRRDRVTLAGTRIGIPRSFYDSLDAELAEAVRKALDVLRDSGAVLVEEDIRDVRDLAARASVILAYETPREIEEFLQNNQLMSIDVFIQRLQDRDTKLNIQHLAQNRISERVYRQAIETDRPALQSAYADYFAQHDLAAALMPTTLAPAELVASNPVPSPSNTYPSSLAGLPCLSLPGGLTRTANLPVGIELVSPTGRDRLLLGIGHAIATAFGDFAWPDL